ncbi:hypothetical protein [Mucilaginibacter paludis]|uniref:Uncharacterized protein n=1 Tax=Mucilaginibacter paludis DSM 18603 TaxID=714943 RepID=H1Y2Y5_9SPHI|nr:hypothetical protein [Mucilaginibacter paludis]EHQ28530.1 hypothetical protein Mucpa_4440 [Mucilaginibacter paludis DSM 18603]
MKKLFVILSIFLFAEQTQAQKNYYLSPVSMDSSVSVSLPRQFNKTNANNQLTYAANGEYGTMVVIKSANPANAQIVKNEKGLNNVFQEYIKKVQSSLTNATVVNDHDVTVGKLEMRDFALQVDTGSGLQVRHFRLLYTKNNTYTFEYLYDDFRKDAAVGEMNAFFQSIKTTPDLDRNDQYVTTSQGERPVIVNILLFGLLPLTAIIAIVVFFRRRNTSLT